MQACREPCGCRMPVAELPSRMRRSGGSLMPCRRLQRASERAPWCFSARGRAAGCPTTRRCARSGSATLRCTGIAVVSRHGSQPAGYWCPLEFPGNACPAIEPARPSSRRELLLASRAHQARQEVDIGEHPVLGLPLLRADGVTPVYAQRWGTLDSIRNRLLLRALDSALDAERFE